MSLFKIQRVNNLEKEFKDFKIVFESAFNMDYSFEFFKWKYLSKETKNSHLLRISVDNKIVGYRGLWNINSINSDSYQCIDTCIHKDFKGVGLFKKSNEYIKNNYSSVYNLPNENSLPGYLKSGWKIQSNLIIIPGKIRKVYSFTQDFLKWRFLDKPNFKYYQVPHSSGGFDVYLKKKGFYFYLLTTDKEINNISKKKFILFHFSYSTRNNFIKIKETGKVLVMNKDVEITPFNFDMF
ncbi:hypothetical protein N9464_03160 [Flavobacteriaceae bacterium]|nr:hypothetical protein [Flavobacteriaceae bacterium]